jgi:hypothetical protein
MIAAAPCAHVCLRGPARKAARAWPLNEIVRHHRMIAIFASICLAIFAARAWVLISRHSGELSKLGRRWVLAGLCLLYPIAPFVLMLGIPIIGALASVVIAAACYVPALLLGRRALRVLECQGTDRVEGAISAVSSVIGGAIAGLSYVVIIGIFVVTWHFYPG